MLMLSMDDSTLNHPCEWTEVIACKVVSGSVTGFVNEQGCSRNHWNLDKRNSSYEEGNG